MKKTLYPAQQGIEMPKKQEYDQVSSDVSIKC